MVSQKEALEILNKERDYEDKIAEDLMGYMSYSLNEIEDMSEEEISKVREVLSKISNESRGHSQMFTKLIEGCMESGNDNF